MDLQLIRYCYGPDSVQGLLKFGKQHEMSLWTLECPWRDNAIFISCVPDGSYTLVAFDSPEHPDCWVLTPIQNRNGILIHVGNTVTDTQGCILIGQSQKPGSVGNSRDALRQLNFSLNRNEQHIITLGPGMGARLEQQAPDIQPDGSTGSGNGDLADPPADRQPDIL